MPSVADEIEALVRRRGAIPFAEFMELSLYGEGGYYARETVPIGADGDFVTGSSLSRLFAGVTARVVRRLREALGGRCVYLEAGFGNGEHLREVASILADEPSTELLAWDRVARPVPDSVRSLAGLDALEEGEVNGLVFSYELFDAFPVHRLIGLGDGGIGELWVGLDENGNYEWRRSALSDPQLAGLLGGENLDAGQVADLSPRWADVYRQLANCLGRGLLVTCDYGFERPRLLDRRVRQHGTLACYTRHRVHRNPFTMIGEQDLTAHVDFTALREIGEAQGLKTISFSRQARWLASAGLFDELDGSSMQTREEAMSLLDGEGMGEEIRVLVQARGIAAEAVLSLEVLGTSLPPGA